ncbi:zinc ribbon domain-containing protein [Psychrosphaera haliotis]|uniref:zinc ribbon domain-containing protein n=1 Tax=Psychrosphaera haliotis TaxID=555083 RepID=UPI00236E8EFC|nr:zinc ribbon domain-containing protein [Psychrosphaera haliotis]
MAIMKCPQCGKSISDKQKVCPHCELDMTNLTEEKIHSLSKIKSLKYNQSLQTHQFIATLLFLAGCFSYYNIEDKASPQFVAAQASILVGFIWYVVNRFRIIWAKRSLKK